MDINLTGSPDKKKKKKPKTSVQGDSIITDNRITEPAAFPTENGPHGPETSNIDAKIAKSN